MIKILKNVKCCKPNRESGVKHASGCWVEVNEYRLSTCFFETLFACFE